MRIPFSRVYRAFPELDRFSDEECRRFISELERSGGWGRIGMLLGSILAFLGTCVGMVLLSLVARRLNSGLEVIFILSSPLVAGVASLLVRDRWLLRGIRRWIDDSRCEACQYSLVGLPVEQGRVSCPECGRLNDLAARSGRQRAGAAEWQEA